MEESIFNYVTVKKVKEYDEDLIYSRISDSLFFSIDPQSKVVIKPNWVSNSHKYKTSDWEYVITHPAIITAVLKKLLDILKPGARISILDGPSTETSFEKLISLYPVDKWKKLAEEKNILLEIIDLRDDEWVLKGDVIVERKKLKGDPNGKTLVNFKYDQSEFYGHKKTKRGYYGSDYDTEETNKAHNGEDNLYLISKTVIESDVFINIPKLKTHRKAGITCCLKNLVGINTYKNYLPHHNQGFPDEGGDQFPRKENLKFLESRITSVSNKILSHYKNSGKFFVPFKKVSQLIFGKTTQTIRSGNWYGNDTVWRMILDLNKALLYANPDGTLREDNSGNKKKYIGIVDAIQAGEGFGPLAPDRKDLGVIIYGTNPAMIDAVSARLMGFDPLKIPAIRNAFAIKNYPVCSIAYENIKIKIDNEYFPISAIPEECITPFEPAFSWKGHIEYSGS